MCVRLFRSFTLNMKWMLCFFSSCWCFCFIRNRNRNRVPTRIHFSQIMMIIILFNLLPSFVLWLFVLCALWILLVDGWTVSFEWFLLSLASFIWFSFFIFAMKKKEQVNSNIRMVFSMFRGWLVKFIYRLISLLMPFFFLSLSVKMEVTCKLRNKRNSSAE